jgi:primosomal protein N' (replication factor Y)
MQYAQIIPKTKNSLEQNYFLYAIPPQLLPEIKIGQIVKIPFRNKTTYGIIAKIQKNASKNLKLKKIINIIDIEPIFTKENFLLAKWIKNNYLISLSKAAFAIINIPPEKKQKKIYKSLSKIKPNYLLKDKIRNIQKLIKEKEQTGILIIAPEKKLAKYLVREFSNKYLKVFYYDASLSKNQKWDIYQKTKKEKNFIIIGTQKTAFLPLSNVKKIIFINADSYGFVNNQNPKLDARQIILKRNENKNIKIYFISNILPIKFLKYWQKRKFIWIKEKNIFSAKIIEYQKDFYNDLINENQKKLIKKYLLNNKKILIILNRKGWMNILYCPDCGNIKKCPKCNSNLSIADSKIYCPKCLQEYNNDKCSYCKGTKIKFFSPGIDFLEAEAKKIFPKAKILKINKKNEDETKKFDILLGTQKAISKIYQSFDLSIVLDADNYKYSNNFEEYEKSYILIKKIYSITKDYLFLQVDNNFDQMSKLLLNINDFYKYDLLERKKYNLPPFSKILIIKRRFKNIFQGEKEAKKLYNRLLMKYNVSSPHYLSIFHNKKGYGWKIILKTKNISNQIKKDIDKNWMIETSPENLV